MQLKKADLVMMDGKPVAILRPADPEKPVKIARGLIGKKADKKFQDILCTQAYLFLGWMVVGDTPSTRKVLNAQGELVDMQPGDSMVEGDMENGQPVLRP